MPAMLQPKTLLHGRIAKMLGTQFTFLLFTHNNMNAISIVLDLLVISTDVRGKLATFNIQKGTHRAASGTQPSQLFGG